MALQKAQRKIVRLCTISVYHGKSETLKKFPLFNEYTISNAPAGAIDLWQIVKGMDVKHCKTFDRFTNALCKKVSSHFKDHKRIDLRLFDTKYYY